MKSSIKLLSAVFALTMLTAATYAAQESGKPAYKPKENNSAAMNSPAILLFKIATPEEVPEANPVKKAGRPERTSAIPSLNRLKAESRKPAASSEG
jgi:hypothetical protein